MGSGIILNSSSNIILAEGHRPRFWNSWKIIVVGILLGLLVLFGLFVLMLNRGLPLPEGTLFYAIATPAEVQALSPEIKQALPPDWQIYANERSSWPFVFGLYREGESIFGFVISPLWHVPKTEKIHQARRGFAMLAADTKLPERKTRSYWSYVFERWWSGSPVIGVDPAEALGAVNGHEPSWLTFSYKSGLVRSNFPLPAAPTEPLSDADLSFRLPPGKESALQGFESLAFLPAPDRLVRLPELSQVDLQFGEPGIASWTKLTFKAPLDESQAGVLLGSYGFTLRRPITLPDGTVSFERIEPVATSGTSLLGPRRDEKGRSANISNHIFTLLSASTTPEIVPATNCANSGAWMRLSSKTVAALARRFGLNVNSELVHPIQIVSDKGKMAICFE
ncbi:hypothetical protein M0Q28_04090 [Patescibacteria group bacterium]|jgi:hypothetical protein|nr:hypothetical protein [Patescibacteria group bacterium]